MHDIQRRNKAIRQRYFDLVGQKVPIMLAYTMTGKEFYLSERRVREIISKMKYKMAKIANKKLIFVVPLHS
ncbi:MAG: hypothetical protein IKY49_04125 [Paludibacteraceae bacterium]|nr:hypothetical protein [Paludibacteraceae bacterium]